jgi:hypothetical protein
MIIIGDDSEYIAFVKTHLSEQFLMKILVLFTTFLGLRVLLYSMASLFPTKIKPRSLYSCSRVTLSDECITKTPMKLNIHLHPFDGDTLFDPTRYRRVVYLVITRPCIFYPFHKV